MVGDSNVLTLLLMNFEHNTFYNNHVLLKELSFYFSLEAKKKIKTIFNQNMKYLIFVI